MRKIPALLLICLASLPAFSQSPADIQRRKSEMDSLIRTTEYGKNKSAGKFYELRGIKMYCEIYGEGDPLLIIHGNGGSIDNFVKQIPFFSKKYRVIIADSRAQGKTADPGDSLSYEMMADDYSALLTALHVDSANVIGWSDGGIEGLLLAIHHPEKVKKLAITGANLRPDTSAVDPGVYKIVQPMFAGMKKSKDTSARFKTSYKLFRLLCEEPNIPLSDLHKISALTLVMGGDHDVIPVTHTVQIWQNIPRAWLWIFPNSGHSTPVVYAEEFNRKVDLFFQSPYRRIENWDRIF
jgi:pimeloyl-ACP methyl ester carboxylesterase